MIRRLGDRPRLVAEAAIAGAWLLVLSHPLAVAAGVHHHDGTTFASWLVMSAAMMLPAALPAVQHVAVNSLRRRRHRAVALYVAAYLGVWALVGAVVVAAPALPAVVVLAVAAAWQLAPWQRHFLRWCHRTVPLPVSGWAATRGSVRFGLRNAAPCVGSCWALMLVAVAIPGTAWMVALTVAVGVAKTARRPIAVSRRIGYALGLATLVAVPAGGAYAPLGALAVAVALVPASAVRQTIAAARATAASASSSP